MGIKIPVDFTGVEERGSVRAPEGDYILKVKTVKKENSKNSGNPMLVVRFTLESGPEDVRGKGITDRHVLIQDSLWTLRNMLEAMGYKVPAKQMKLDVDSMLIGKTVGATLVDGEEYKGRIKSEIADYLPVSAVGNRVDGDDTGGFMDDDEDDDGGFGAFEDDDEGLLSDDEEDEAENFGFADEDEDESVDEPEEDDDDEDSFEFEDDDEDEEDEGVELSFGPDDIENAKGKALIEYVMEASEHFDLGLGKKPKVAEVREALLSLFEDDDDEDDDFEMEEFSLDDV